VDIEKINAELVSAAVSEEFSRSEKSLLANVGPDKRLKAFFKCWTSKEAYIKGLGAGLSIALEDFDVCVDPDKPVRLVRPLRRTSADWYLHGIDSGEEYAAALATACPDAGLRLFDLGASSGYRAAEGGPFIRYSR
jgi:4'-phosphopantetheinyl transferase